MLHKRPPLLFALALLLAVSRPLSADEPANPLATLELSDGDCVVFLGDSITHQCLYTQYVEDYFYTRFPGKRIVFHNAGVGGAKAWDALQRFDRDVAAYKPKYVTVLLGMNDGAYQAFNQDIWQTYRKDMTELVGRIKETGATPVLMTPTMFDNRARRMKENKTELGDIALYNGVLAFYGTWLRDVAQVNGDGFVDMWSPLNNLTIQERKANPKFTMIADAVHPGPDGQLVMAAAMLEDLGLRKPLSNIRVTAGKTPKATAGGGEVTELAETDDGLTFTWTAAALPFVVPESAQQGAKMLHLGHRFTREALTVNGLEAGNYDLLIDGEPVGAYTAAQLAHGVELQDNDKTPQHKQAAAVAALNQRRNQGPVASLRNQWGQFQGYARTKADTANWENKEAAAEKLKEAEARIAGMDDEIKKQEAAAQAIEDEIFQVNQPKPHRYELKRAGAKAAGGKQAAVSGTITLDGLPLNAANVRFLKDGQAATGQTDDTGRFVLTWDNRPRVPVGMYRVVVEHDGLGPRYTDPERTQLMAQVRAGDNVLDLALQSK